jgi:hypothetical protein
MELRGFNRVARRHFGSTAEGRARAALGDVRYQIEIFADCV